MFATKKSWLKLTVAGLVVFLLVVPNAPSQERSEESGRVVAVIAVDSLDNNIGKAVAKDGERVKAALEDGFSKNKDRLDLKPTISGAKVTPDNILEFLDKLPVERTDTLFFYYSGHGAWDDTKGQYLQMYSGPVGEKGDLFRSTLVGKLKAKNPRLVVLLTDCCNSVAPSRAPLTRDSKDPVQWETLRSLLLRPKGVADITSSAKGESSWAWPSDAEGNAQGSLFTLPLVVLLRTEEKKYQPQDWEQAIAILKEWTQESYLKYRKGFFEFYNDLPEERKAKLKRMADQLREQGSQTVHKYSLPSS